MTAYRCGAGLVQFGLFVGLFVLHVCFFFLASVFLPVSVSFLVRLFTSLPTCFVSLFVYLFCLRRDVKFRFASKVGFLVGICLPCYELMWKCIPETKPLLEGGQ